MQNLDMERKIKKAQAVDVSKCARTEEGDYILEQFVEDVDYCDAQAEVWIWSIGRNLKTGQLLASASGKFYQNPDFECIWLR